jgi:hypothetical protein
MADDDFLEAGVPVRQRGLIEDCGPTRLIDDRSLRILRARSTTLDGGLQTRAPAAAAIPARVVARSPPGLRYWGLPVMLVGAAATWFSLRPRSEPVAQQRVEVVETPRVVMPVVAPTLIEMPDDPVVARPIVKPAPKSAAKLKPAPKLKRTPKRSLLAKRSALRAKSK